MNHMMSLVVEEVKVLSHSIGNPYFLENPKYCSSNPFHFLLVYVEYVGYIQHYGFYLVGGIGHWVEPNAKMLCQEKLLDMDMFFKPLTKNWQLDI